MIRRRGDVICNTSSKKLQAAALELGENCRIVFLIKHLKRTTRKTETKPCFSLPFKHLSCVYNLTLGFGDDLGSVDQIADCVSLYEL